MVGFSTCNVVFMLTLILTQETGKVMFTIWIFAIFFCFSGIFSIFPMATARSFGEEYAGEIYGLLYTSITVSTILGTLYINILSKQVGWYLLLLCSVFSRWWYTHLYLRYWEASQKSYTRGTTIGTRMALDINNRFHTTIVLYGRINIFYVYFQ
ncbi:apicoplast pyruvate carrier 1-like [Ptychodera flava]|uniref:apicoplast pyruvate carrier 1-like n=1 Tax=Ptychodera flava TaxID=63121 RepID=UPI00396A63B5